MGQTKEPVLQAQCLLREPGNPFKKKQSVEISFRHITYKVRRHTWRKPFIEKKEILHGVNGDMMPGTLTAIMGPSGAGKSTLLNILAGYKVAGSSGQVLINGIERTAMEMPAFLRLSCYIQQDSSLRETLTVQEAMMVAAELKLGQLATRKEKQFQVQQLLTMLGLDKSLNTISGRLSGGQQKRLAIAFELITNPPILFLDEPTTGLDSMSCSQCISILKMLAREGRTIITTIHQPSALIFEMFDSVYALADGYCIYNGPIMELVPYLADKGLQCPVYHNPADFLLEVAIGEYGPVLDQLLIKAEPREKTKKEDSFNFNNFSIEDIKEGIKRRKLFKCDKSSPNLIHPNTFIMEFYYLYMRNLIVLQRNYRFRLTTLLSHVLCGTLIGFTFYDVGNNAAMVRNNMAFVFGVLIFVVYVGLMTVSLILPSDLKSMKVEHFNQWYSLTPYYLSLLSIEIPMQAINCILAVPILYTLSNQPLEIFRGFVFLLFVTTTALTAQSFGFLLGTALPVKIGVFVGPVMSCVLSVFGFTLRFCDTPFIFQLVALGSYIRSAFHSIAFTLYSYGRQPLVCDKDSLYCHFRTPEKLLKEMDMAAINIYANLTYIIVVGALAHVITYILLFKRLNKR